jgi:hypothetical protein
LGTESRSAVNVLGVVFQPIAETNACLEIELVWRPERDHAAVLVVYLHDETRLWRLV